MKLKLLDQYILVFAVVNKKKFGKFFTPQTTSYSDYYEAIGVWITEFGPKCRIHEDGVGLGTKCYVLDAYELDSDIPFNIMQAYGDRVSFSEEILKEAKDTDGDIKAFVIHEKALLAVKESTCQKNPLLQWPTT